MKENENTCTVQSIIVTGALYIPLYMTQTKAVPRTQLQTILSVYCGDVSMIIVASTLPPSVRAWTRPLCTHFSCSKGPLDLPCARPIKWLIRPCFRGGGYNSINALLYRRLLDRPKLRTPDTLYPYPKLHVTKYA